MDNFINWMINSARVFTSIPDITCASVGTFGWDAAWYEKYLVNATTSPFNTKLVYYDSSSGTQAMYGCLDTKVANKILDYFTSEGLIGTNWYYKALVATILLGNYVEGVVVFSTTNSISDSVRSAIQSTLWSQAGYWLPTDAIKVNTSKCSA